MRAILRLLALLLMLVPAQAYAHAQLIGASPANGAVLPVPPAAVVLEFNEPVSPLVMTWIAPDGTTLTSQTTPEGARVHVTAARGTGRGTHLVSWRVVSEDGHPISGTLVFSIGAASAQAPLGGGVAPGSAWHAAAARFLLTVALVFGVGGAVFAAFVAPPAPSAARFARWMTRAVLPLAVLALGLQGLDLLGLGPLALVTAAPWAAVAEAPLMRSAGLAAVAALIAWSTLGRGIVERTFGAKIPALAAWVLASASFAASGHAALADPRWLAAPAVAVHAAAVIFWLGALVPLLAAAHHADAEAVLWRFGRLALMPVVLLLISGGALSLLQAGPKGPTALAGTAYGAVLGAKLMLVALLLGLALFNRRWLTPAIARAAGWGRRAIGRTIRAEILLGLLILALASAFRLTPPPRALRETPPAFAHFHGTAAMADLAMLPGRAGPNEIMLNISSATFEPLHPREVSLDLALPGRGIEPIRLRATPTEDGRWHAGPVTLPVSGQWEVTLRLLITDFQLEALGATLVVAP